MTGKELVMYILENDLLDKEVVEDNKPIFLMTLEEASCKFDVGPMTIRVWVSENKIDYCTIGCNLYIYTNAKDPRK